LEATVSASKILLAISVFGGNAQLLANRYDVTLSMQDVGFCAVNEEETIFISPDAAKDVLKVALAPRVVKPGAPTYLTYAGLFGIASKLTIQQKYSEEILRRATDNINYMSDIDRARIDMSVLIANRDILKSQGLSIRKQDNLLRLAEELHSVSHLENLSRESKVTLKEAAQLLGKPAKFTRFNIFVGQELAFTRSSSIREAVATNILASEIHRIFWRSPRYIAWYGGATIGVLLLSLAVADFIYMLEKISTIQKQLATASSEQLEDIRTRSNAASIFGNLCEPLLDRNR
jgi:hypothetical protein